MGSHRLWRPRLGRDRLTRSTQNFRYRRDPLPLLRYLSGDSLENLLWNNLQ